MKALYLICFHSLIQIADLANEDTPQLYVACGRGPSSSLRVLRHGLEVGSVAAVWVELLEWHYLGSRR